jgi:hypothetical protein
MEDQVPKRPEGRMQHSFGGGDFRTAARTLSAPGSERPDDDQLGKLATSNEAAPKMIRTSVASGVGEGEARKTW